MEEKLFELTPEELRAVIGGAIYYTSVNWLPMGAQSGAAAKAPAPAAGFELAPVR